MYIIPYYIFSLGYIGALFLARF